MKPFSFAAYCTANDLTYPRLAKLLAISRSYACQLRLGRKPITLKMARKLHATLGLSLEMLLMANGKPKPRRKVKDNGR